MAPRYSFHSISNPSECRTSRGDEVEGDALGTYIEGIEFELLIWYDALAGGRLFPDQGLASASQALTCEVGQSIYPKLPVSRIIASWSRTCFNFSGVPIKVASGGFADQLIGQ